MAASALCAIASSAVAQSFTPRTIQFKGVPEYTNQELLAGAGIPANKQIDVARISSYGQRLIDTGMFATVSYKFDGQDLVFTLSAMAELAPIRLDNLPLTMGNELAEKLHARLPLFHGKVPMSGGLNDEVAKTLEQILTEQGMPATVQAAAGSSQTAAITYSIISPSVVVGDIKLTEDSAKPDPGIQKILKALVGSPYQVDGSPSQISTYLSNYYHDKGYVEAAVDVLPHGPATAAQDAISVPFTITIKPGILYRLASVNLAPDMVLSQKEFDHQSPIHPGDIAEGQRITENWEFISRQYHNHGYMSASIHPEPAFDRDKGTVAYNVTAKPGPVYTMGKLTLDNAPDDMRAAILSAWKMPEGSTFNEGAIRAIAATHGVNPTVERIFTAYDIRYSLNQHDDSLTVDVVLKLEKKH
jgi:hypothetical protein